MSDGPHRSLKMRPGWKKVAKFADMLAASPDEVGHAVAAAFSEDWRADVAANVAECIREVLGGQKDSLFRDQKVMQLEALRPLTAGRELAQIFLDCAIQRVVSGEATADAVVEAAADALDIWGSRQVRHVEEQYCRESTVRRADNVRHRIEEGIGSTPRGALARQLLKLEPKTTSSTPQKQTGLNDGVRL